MRIHRHRLRRVLSQHVLEDLLRFFNRVAAYAPSGGHFSRIAGEVAAARAGVHVVRGNRTGVRGVTGLEGKGAVKYTCT